MNCLKTLKSEYAELEELGFLHSAMRLAFPRFIHVLKNHHSSKHWIEDGGNEARLTRIRSRPDTECRGLFVLAWGSFEGFLRRYIEETALLWNSKGHHKRPGDSIWSQHALVCSTVVAESVRGKGYRKVNLEQISIDMHKGICATGPWPLNPEALSTFGGNMDQGQLENYGKRVGVDLCWSKIGKGKKIRALSGKNGDSAVGEWAMEKFCSTRDKRNMFAHEGVGQTDCKWSEVKEAIEFLGLLGERLVERSQEDLGA
jgi:hypothetical protein